MRESISTDRCRICSGEQTEIVEENVRDFEYGSPGSYNYLKCSRCGVYRVDPLPDEQILALAYPETYRVSKTLWSPGNRGAGFLDLGCGRGDFLLAMKRLGFTRVKGVDFDPESVKEAQERGLEVHRGELEDVPLEEGSFDLITMSNYIEHLFDLCFH